MARQTSRLYLNIKLSWEQIQIQYLENKSPFDIGDSLNFIVSTHSTQMCTPGDRSKRLAG